MDPVMGAGEVEDNHSMGAEEGISVVHCALMGKFQLSRGIYSAL